MYHSSFLEDSLYLCSYPLPILNLIPRHSPFECGRSSQSYYVCKQSLWITCDAVSIVSSIIKLSLFKQQVLLILRWKMSQKLASLSHLVGEVGIKKLVAAFVPVGLHQSYRNTVLSDEKMSIISRWLHWQSLVMVLLAKLNQAKECFPAHLCIYNEVGEIGIKGLVAFFLLFFNILM